MMLDLYFSKLGRLGKVFGFFSEYYQDLWLFLRHNSYSPFEDADRRLSYRTIIETHTIEKGLALPAPRPHFGQAKIRALIEMNRHPCNERIKFSRAMLSGALQDYKSAFRRVAAPDTSLATQISDFIADQADVKGCGGVREVNELPQAADPAAVSFLEHRFSARDFAPGPLDDSEIRRVVSLAQRAPSQCNRQSTRVHIYRDPDLIQGLLTLQAGANGFMEKVPTLFVITSEITAWGGSQQRNQPYVDGGIYCMSLLSALWVYGFVSCPLNLAVSNRRERQIKLTGSIPTRERLVAMVAAGRPPANTLRAAKSPRFMPEDVVTIHNA